MQNNITKFQPLGVVELTNILGLTIKQDQTNKIITFLAELSAFSESSQFNISFNAPSSTGKSYIPLEIARLFPEEDLMELGHVSTTSFFHDVSQREYIEETNSYRIDLSRKIIIFIDQPHTHFMERFRPLLSHDRKEITSKITDKNQAHGLRTKNIIIRGYPTVIFCTAGLNIDEQEATRFLLLSPEITQEKIRASIEEKIKRESDAATYQQILEANPERKLLKERIRAIRDEKIGEIRIASPELIINRFLQERKFLRPRHQRDIGRIMSLAKSLALLNVWWRERNGDTVIATDEDVAEAFSIWEGIAQSQELNLPQFVFDLFKDVIVPAWREKREERNIEPNVGVVLLAGGSGLLHHEIATKYFEVYHMQMPFWQLRKVILPLLETAGLISNEVNTDDKRTMVVKPTTAGLAMVAPEEAEEGEHGS